MTGSIDASPGFRRRRRNAGAAVLLDETAALLQTDPLGWLGRAWLPTLPLALMGLLFVHLHRVVWAQEAWGLRTTGLSLLVSAGVVLALGLRAVGHGLAARAVSAQLDPRRAESMPPADIGSLAALGWLAAACCLPAFVAVYMPGAIIAAFFLPTFAVCACEGRDAGSTLQRLSRLPKGTAAKGFSSVLLFSLLALFVWFDVVASVQAGLIGVRMLTGADVDVLARLLGPTNGAFLMSAVVVAAFLLDGVWCVYSAVFYVDARLGQSGADLLDRWEEITGPPARAFALLVALLPFGCVLSVPAVAAAQPGEPGEAVINLDWPSEAEAIEPPEYYLRDLQTWRAQLETELQDYEATGFEDLDDLRDALRWQTSRTLMTPEGPLAVDGSILAEELPEWIHTEDTAEQARLFVGRLDEAIARLTAMQEPAVAPDPAAPPREAGPDPRALLDAELEGGGYDLAAEATEGDAFRESFQERWRAWVEDLWRRLSDYEPRAQTRRQGALPEFDGRIVMAAVAAVLGLIIVLFLLGQSRTLRVAAPEAEEDDAGLGGDLPDARKRSPLAWRGHADDLAAEGLFREAIRAQYLAVLARLDRTGEIDYRQERTNGEHLRTFRGLAPRRACFGDATWTFEVAWYGEADVGRADYGGMTAVCDGLVLRDQRDEAPPTGSEVGRA